METKLTFKTSIKAGIFAGITSAIINGILFFIFHAAGIFNDAIEIQPGQALNIVPVSISSIMPSIIAILVFYLFEKYTKNGLKNFSILAYVLLALSFLNPFLMIPNVTVMYALILNLMHVVVVASLLFYIKRAYQNK